MLLIVLVEVVVGPTAKLVVQPFVQLATALDSHLAGKSHQTQCHLYEHNNLVPDTGIISLLCGH